MTQLQLNRQLARITGEPLGTFRALGFGILTQVAQRVADFTSRRRLGG